MSNFIELSQEEIELGFVASCIEAIARISQVPYADVVARMKRLSVVENFILPYYDQLHSESMEQAVNNILQYMNNKESGKI